MQNWLGDNDTLMSLTHNEGKSVVPEIVIKILKGKVYKTMTANDSKFYNSYLNKLLDQYNNTYHRSNGKISFNVDYFVLTKDIASNHKSPKFTVGDIVRITK